MNTVKVSSKCQVVIPKEVREQMDLKPGQEFHVLWMHGGIQFIPVRPVQELRGLFKDNPVVFERDETERDL